MIRYINMENHIYIYVAIIAIIILVLILYKCDKLSSTKRGSNYKIWLINNNDFINSGTTDIIYVSLYNGMNKKDPLLIENIPFNVSGLLSEDEAGLESKIVYVSNNVPVRDIIIKVMNEGKSSWVGSVLIEAENGQVGVFNEEREIGRVVGGHQYSYRCVDETFYDNLETAMKECTFQPTRPQRVYDKTYGKYNHGYNI